MKEFWYEILLGDQAIPEAEWQEFLGEISRLVGPVRAWQIYAQFDHNILHYYLRVTHRLPASVYCANFLLKPVEVVAVLEGRWRGIHCNRWDDNIIDLRVALQAKSINLSAVWLNFRGLQQHFAVTAYIIYQKAGRFYQRTLPYLAPAQFLSVDFRNSQNLAYKKFPKYLGIEKIVHLLSSGQSIGWLEPETFPYLEQPHYLPLAAVDFAKHSLVLGGSGTGKSKFLAGLVQQIRQTSEQQYQVVIIDPHAALQEDLCDIPDRTVVDFASTKSSTDLFANHVENLGVGVELMLGLFRGLIGEAYNSRLERVLRFSTYLLMSGQAFDFGNLRRLLLDLDYRQEFLQSQRDVVPVNVSQFFLTDFQEVKNQHYNEAIAPIIAFVDEMQMVPVFSESAQTVGLDELLQTGFLHIFSLSRLCLGDKVVQTIAGLLFQQLFLAAQQRHDERQLVVIIDEVAVVESPILTRFLAELRKYHVNVILAGQYFEQITPELRAAILANVTNYYLFRVSRLDANLLVKQLEIKPTRSEKLEDQLKLLTDLKLRECLVKLDAAGEPLPVFKAKTLDFVCGEAVAARAVPLKTSAGQPDSLLSAQFEFDHASCDSIPVPFVITSRKKLI